MSKRDYYEVLGVSRNADASSIKSAYRKLAMKHHPDKVSHMGDQFRAAAKEKFQQILKAYKLLCKRRGIV